jgi:hypothetical protein
MEAETLKKSVPEISFLNQILFTFRPPPLNFSLNLVDLVILAFLDGDYFYKSLKTHVFF